MSKSRNLHPLPLLVLSLTCLALAAVVYQQAGNLRNPPDPPAPTTVVMTKRDSIPSQISMSFPRREAFAEVAARPIFSPTRRPAVVTAEAAEPSASQTFDADLVGIVIWPAQRMALVRANGAEGIVRVPEGGAVSGWIIVTIEPGRVVLRQRGSERELHLPYKTAEEGE